MYRITDIALLFIHIDSSFQLYDNFFNGYLICIFRCCQTANFLYAVFNN